MVWVWPICVPTRGYFACRLPVGEYGECRINQRFANCCKETKMSMTYLIDKVTQYLSWLYHRQWEQWEFAVAAIAALGLVTLLIRARQKVAANTRLYRDRSPIIGIELAEYRRRPRTKSSQNNRLAPVAERHISKQTEEHFKQRMAELEAVNERLQHDLTESRQTTEHFKQQLTALTATNKQLKQELIKRINAQKQLKLQVAELITHNEQPRHKRPVPELSEKETVESSEAGSTLEEQKPLIDIKEFSKATLPARSIKRNDLTTEDKSETIPEQRPE